MTSCTIWIMRPGDTKPEIKEVPRPQGYDGLRVILDPLLGTTDLEHVTVVYDGRRADMFVDECGTLRGLPRNEMATEHYRRFWLTEHPEQDPEAIPFMVGPAVLFPDELVWR